MEYDVTYIKKIFSDVTGECNLLGIKMILNLV